MKKLIFTVLILISTVLAQITNPNLADGSFTWSALGFPPPYIYSTSKSMAFVHAYGGTIFFLLYDDYYTTGPSIRCFDHPIDWNNFTGVYITYTSDNDLILNIRAENPSRSLQAILPAGTNQVASLDLSDFEMYDGISGSTLPVTLLDKSKITGISIRTLETEVMIIGTISNLFLLGAVSNSCSHNWNDWEITAFPTCQQKGSIIRTCKLNPSHTETSILAQLTNNDITSWVQKLLESCGGNVSFSNTRSADNRYGILLENAVVSEKAEMEIILPNNEKVAETKIVVYDMTGNVVFETEVRGNKADWNLRNSAGRFVGNGSYLVVAEVKNRDGKVYLYSARLGVKR